MPNRGTSSEQPGQIGEPMSNTLDAIPAEARAVIVDELSRRDPALLDELRGEPEPTTEQSDRVNLLLARAIIDSLWDILSASERPFVGLRVQNGPRRRSRRSGGRALMHMSPTTQDKFLRLIKVDGSSEPIELTPEEVALIKQVLNLSALWRALASGRPEVTHARRILSSIGEV